MRGGYRFSETSPKGIERSHFKSLEISNVARYDDQVMDLSSRRNHRILDQHSRLTMHQARPPTKYPNV